MNAKRQLDFISKTFKLQHPEHYYMDESNRKKKKKNHVWQDQNEHNQRKSTLFFDYRVAGVANTMQADKRLQLIGSN